jgi:CotS family spore coat protein
MNERQEYVLSWLHRDDTFLFQRRDSVEKTVIEPWVVDELTHEFFVPDYINQLAEEVLKSYDLSVQSIQVVTTKPDKGGAIWKLETKSGPKSLKLLHRRPTRSLFSLGAQEYLVEVQEARVPPIVKTKDGNNYVEAGGKLWFVAEWIEPLTPVTKDLEGAKQLCYALGEFHRLSKGYIPPEKAEIASRLHKWPKNYKKVIAKMEWFRTIAKAYEEMPASSHLLNVVDQFEEQARRSLERLNQSSYFELIKQGNAYWGLVHQDYGWSNGQMGAEGMWIIDLDGVAFDLPIRDLRKLISGTMADLYRWDVTWVREMIKAYHEANPITAPLYEILMIDLSLPNEFYKNIKEVVYEPELFLNEPTTTQLIQTIVETDQSKWPVLEEIQNDWKGME